MLTAATVAVALSGCVTHPVGPARTFGKYESKARTTAKSALSEVQTARLMAVTSTDDRSFGPYTGTVLSDAEESLNGLAGTFGSIQPPDTQADDLRDALETILGDAEEHVTTLRIAARRGQKKLDVSDLDDDINVLEQFLQDHGG